MFDDWWQLYPRKEAKKHAMMMWTRLTADQQTKALETLPAHIKKWAGEGRLMVHIPHAGSWLNGWRFEDDITAPCQLVYTVNTATRLPTDTVTAMPDNLRKLVRRA